MSGKKFKGPDFVRKHIMTKHTEKVDEVKKEVNFFNNYLRVGSLIRAALTVIMILFLRIRSAHSCRNTRRQRQEPEGRQVPATTGGRGGGEIPMSTGTNC